MPVEALAVDCLFRVCDPQTLPFSTTEELEDLNGLFGQDRALAALKLGTGMDHDGYNLFVVGPPNCGKQAAVRAYLEHMAADEPTPPDWVYVNNFEDEEKPIALRLNPGDGKRFKDGMAALIEALSAGLPAIFESEEYVHRRRALEEALDKRQQDAFDAIRDKANAQGVALVETSTGGIAVAPMKDGELMPNEALAELGQDERQELETAMDAAHAALEKLLSDLPDWHMAFHEDVRKLNEEFVDFAVGHSMNELRRRFEGEEALLRWLKSAHDDIVENAHIFAPAAAETGEAAETITLVGFDGVGAGSGDPLRRYRVNLLVDNRKTRGAPVIAESHPTFNNICGRIEQRTQGNALVTDFTMVRPGSLHLANGGYLLIDARRLLTEPMAWEALKRTLETGRIQIESLAEQVHFISHVTLAPDAVPLDIKVVLFGEPSLYYALCRLEPDFPSLFKVQVEFEHGVVRDKASEIKLARIIGTIARRDRLKPVDASGVARMIEHASRLTDDAERLSILTNDIADTLREADYWTREEGRTEISHLAVERALAEQRYRASRLAERMREQILRESRVIETAGERVGQINALGVYALPNIRFAMPSRVTVRVRHGGGDVLDIDRQVGLTGRIHNKGVEILSAFLKAKFGETRKLNFSATLVFEQHYGRSDGDSASSTELYALLSALADMPLKQNIAVTGSVNQFGEIQAIGGVNEKIEGFFDLCSERGLTGDQGVMIPKANVKNLMLRRDVVAAAAEGRFHIYAVESLDEGIELMSGLTPGERDKDGNFPKESLYGKVEERLSALAQAGGNSSNRHHKRKWWWV